MLKTCHIFRYMAFFLYLCGRFCVHARVGKQVNMSKKILIILLALAMMWPFVSAQNNTHSPFSRFGYGEMNDNIPGAYRALGGVSIGMRDKRVINPAQPASYTVVDSTTFMFDLAGSGMMNQYADANSSRVRGNGNLEYITMQLPIWKHYIGLSVGLMPYSVVGYDFALSDSVNSNYHYTTSFAGTGGMTQVYGGLSFNVCDWFAVGANLYYMFGDVNNTRSVAFSEGLNSVSETTTLHINDIRGRYGAQFFHTFKKHSFSLGAIVETKTSMNADMLQIETLSDDTITNGKANSDFPLIWGIGAMYNFADRVVVSADYTRYEWASARYYDSSVSLQNRQKVAAGFEYTHNPAGRRYIDVMPWRVGFSYATPYISQISGAEYTASIGTAFPLHNVGTVINLSLEYGHRGSAELLSENWFRATVNVSVRENWFFKRKL